MDSKVEPAQARDAQKRAAGTRAVDLIASGMRVGLGTGSTARCVAEEIAARLRDGRLSDVACVPTSERTRALAQSLAVPLTTLEDHPTLDIAIDGADEIDPSLDLIKGAGGALLREKIVAAAARHFVVVGDDSKRVQRLGEKAAVPVEVVRFGWKTHLPIIERLGGFAALRQSPAGDPFLTDEENYILDVRFEFAVDAREVNRSLRERPGVVETGFFLGMAGMAILGTDSGTLLLDRPDAAG
jgi:ribose 5-phosphate isomerase A